MNPASKLMVLVCALLAGWIAFACPACTRSTELRALSVLTTTASGALDGKAPDYAAEVAVCLTLPTDAERTACVDSSERGWITARTAVDGLLALDKAALDGGSTSMAEALRLYCDLAELWSDLPKPGDVVPGLECP